MGLSNQ